MDILLIAVIILLYSFQTLFCKLFTDNYAFLNVLLFLFSGLYCTFVKIQTVYQDTQKQEMIMLTFGMMAVVRNRMIVCIMSNKPTPAYLAEGRF